MILPACVHEVGSHSSHIRRLDMATVEELVRQYQTDETLQKEVAEILADGKVTAREFLAFAKKHDVDVSLADIPKYMEKAKELGFIK